MENFSSLFRSNTDSESSCLIATKSTELIAQLKTQYSFENDATHSCEYDVIQPSASAYIHLYHRLGIVLFEMNNPGDYIGPQPVDFDQLLHICSICLNTPANGEHGPALVSRSVESMLRSTEFLEILIQSDLYGEDYSQCRATYYKGNFCRTSQNTNRNPCFIKGFRFEEEYISDAFLTKADPA